MPKIRWLLVYAVTTFIMAVTVVTFFKEIGRVERMSDALDAKMDEMAELTLKNQELQEKITYYSTPEGIAYVATEEYNLVRPGQKIYKIEIIAEEQLRKE
ncbi:MAG: septum formation initiator family protein [Synergistaceae bacterium]|nr:septum formation initiator family protein [Synergistaceae bacterium]